MANIDLGNLTRYDGKIKQYAEDKYLSKNTANWQMTEKAGAVACYPVPDTELEPIVDFMFTETPPLDGDKDPSNPSTITGVSSVTVTRCGKNLLSTPYTFGPRYTFSGFTATENNDGSITWSGTTDNNGSCHFRLNDNYSFKLCSGVSYTASLTGAANQNIAFQAYGSDGRIVFTAYAGGTSVTVSVNEDKYVTLRVSVSKEAGSLDNVTVYPQLELGTTATSFEPYSGNDYTISLGNTYYGGSIDLSTGVMTVTWTGQVFNGSEYWNYSNNHGTYYKYSLSLTPNKNTTDIACTHFIRANNLSYESQHYIIALGGIHIFTTQTTLADFKTWLAEQYTTSTPVTIAYALATPYTVQLTPTQIKSLSALDKNTPRLNTLYTNADSIQVGYQKHPARTAYELENAILALGGGE